MSKKIRCFECGNVIAMENEPISGKGEISIMCNNRKANGKRCKTINIINGSKAIKADQITYSIDPSCEFKTTINQKMF